MKAFVHHETFNFLNVGFALDEGIASPSDVFSVFYGEKTCWQVLLRVYGQPGHGSLLLKNTAAENLRKLMDKIYDYRKAQEKVLEDNPDLLIGDVTTMNVTRMKGGKQRNVLPPFIELTVDIRIALTENLDDFELMLRKWLKDCGEKNEMEFIVKEPFCAPTKTDGSNIFWKEFEGAINDLKLKIKPQVFPAGTDAAYLRGVGVPAIGFSPMNNTPILLHDHNEFLQADVYLKGIEIYSRILEKVANAED
jgi:aminoacylase